MKSVFVAEECEKYEAYCADLRILSLFISLLVDRYFLFVIIKPDVKNESSTSYSTLR